MTDVRERVARAIYTAKWGKDPGDWSGSVATITFRLQAEAALIACGYAEMRKALSILVEQDGCFGGGLKWQNAISDARSILERTGDKT